jgi:DNA-binding MarR family transcriptional regulator
MWKSLRERQLERRLVVLSELDSASEALVEAALLFKEALVARQDLSGVEEKALEAIDRNGPLTAGELGARTGLAPASVTGLVTRLVKKGLVKRNNDQGDRRRAQIERRPESLSRIEPLKAELVAELGRLYESYSTDELELCVRFLAEAARRRTAAVARVV